MDGEDKKCGSRIKSPMKKRQHSTIETILPSTSYLRNFTEATILFCSVPSFLALPCNVLYSKIFKDQGLRYDFKLLKTPEKLFLFIYSETLPEKIAEFLIVDEENGDSLKCAAKELAKACYVGEFKHEAYIGSRYLSDNVLKVAFKYFTSRSIYCQDTVSEAMKPLTDVVELCSDYRRAFIVGLQEDFIISTSNYEFKTHRFILAAHSEYFDKFFQKYPEAFEYTCRNDIQPGVMHEILLYMYSGELKKTNLAHMLLVSDLAERFSIKALCQKCGRYFLRFIEETSLRKTGNNRTDSGGQEMLDIGFMRVICEEAFKNKRLDVFAQKCARYLKRSLDKFLHFETCLTTRKYKVKLDDIVQLWRLSYARRLKDIKNQCAMILERCIVDPFFFDAHVKTGKGMGVNLKGVIHVAEFSQKVRSVVLSKKSAKYILDHIEVDLPAANATTNEEETMQTISRVLNIALKEHYTALVDKCFAYCSDFMRSIENRLFLIEDLTSLIKVAYVAKKLGKNNLLAEYVRYFKNYFEYYGGTYLQVKDGSSLIRIIRSTVKLHEVSLDEDLKRYSFKLCHRIVRKNSLGVATQDALRENIDLLKNMLRLSDRLKRIEHEKGCKHSKKACSEDSKTEYGEDSKPECGGDSKKRVKNKKECHKFNKECAIFKKDCASYIEKIIDAFHILANKEIFSDNTLKCVAFLYKFARKRTSLRQQWASIVMEQIDLCSVESNSLRQDHQINCLVTLCNITRKMKMLDLSKKCMSILDHRISVLNMMNNRKGKSPRTSCIEPIVKAYRVFCRFHKRVSVDKRINETDEVSLEQEELESNAAETNRIQDAKECDEERQTLPYDGNSIGALLTRCEDFFDCVLSNIRDLNATESEKVQVMKNTLEICDLTRYHFESHAALTQHLSKYGTRCHNIKLRRKCLEFLAINMADDPYRSLVEPSQEQNMEFLTKLYVLACELREDIDGEKLIMEKEERRCQLPETGELMLRKFHPMEDAHVEKVFKYYKEFFEKLREIDLSKVPEEIRKLFVVNGMILIKFSCDNTRPEQKQMKNVFANYMFLSGLTASVGREEEIKNFNEACKIIEFAYKTKIKDLQNKCIESYFPRYTNKNNWKQLYDLGNKLGSYSLKAVALQNQTLEEKQSFANTSKESEEIL